MTTTLVQQDETTASGATVMALEAFVD